VDFGNRPTFSSRQSVVWPTGTISSTIFSFNMRRGSSGAATGVSCKELFESTMGPKRSAIARPVVSGGAGKFSDRGAYLSVTMDWQPDMDLSRPASTPILWPTSNEQFVPCSGTAHYNLHHARRVLTSPAGGWGWDRQSRSAQMPAAFLMVLRCEPQGHGKLAMPISCGTSHN
jgi:hypothetical protein